MEQYFKYDDRLGIPVPVLNMDWDQYNYETRQSILLDWEKIRGRIPDRIAEVEAEINSKQAELSDESDFKRSCRLNTEIAELASIINDLWLWYRTNQNISGKVHH
ncbi:ABC transporter C-terminal domain-containing protein [Bacillus sp. T33-2]|uniref:ABC transporter C-terminal domain-containing protein n=1 Tax=Bacillus sp. T33-2 TaxID=2054168 RepID=UPI000C75A0CA|nr:ABC transporter C-terminal domain-containing protein [Bacillus sp. T33-2]PLR98142.1 hypothetical protein CVD19_05960 [Bacillus sp. T33-2]